MKFDVPAVVEKLIRIYEDIHFEGEHTYQKGQTPITEVRFRWDFDFKKEKLLSKSTEIVIRRFPKKLKPDALIRFEAISFDALEYLTYEHSAGDLEDLTVEQFMEEFKRAKAIFDAVLASFIQALPELPEEEVTSDV